MVNYLCVRDSWSSLLQNHSLVSLCSFTVLKVRFKYIFPLNQKLNDMYTFLLRQCYCWYEVTQMSIQNMLLFIYVTVWDDWGYDNNSNVLHMLTLGSPMDYLTTVSIVFLHSWPMGLILYLHCRMWPHLQSGGYCLINSASRQLKWHDVIKISAISWC